MKLAIIGYGKMGKAIHRLGAQYAFSEFVIIDNEEDWLINQSELKTCDMAIEFSTPQTVLQNVIQCFEMQLPVVTGTTGWGSKKEEFLKQWQNASVSFIYGSNFSIGANIFFKMNEWLVKQMKMHSQYAVSIEETHHIHKKDMPSGTALTIEQIILPQLNSKTEIPIISHREGEVVGEHLVNYNSIEDSIQIKHSVHDRDALARGALRAAAWLLKNRGIYAFEEIFDSV